MTTRRVEERPHFLASEHATRLARLEERRGVADDRAHEDIDADQARALKMRASTPWPPGGTA